MSLVLSVLATIAIQASPQAKAAPARPPAQQASPASPQNLEGVIDRIGELTIELAEIAGGCEAFVTADERAKIKSGFKAMDEPAIMTAYQRGQAEKANYTEESCDADTTRVTNELFMNNLTFSRLMAERQAAS